MISRFSRRHQDSRFNFSVRLRCTHSTCRLCSCYLMTQLPRHPPPPLPFRSVTSTTTTSSRKRRKPPPISWPRRIAPAYAGAARGIPRHLPTQESRRQGRLAVAAARSRGPRCL
ncbi:unnamed protein product [Musa textilis]